MGMMKGFQFEISCCRTDKVQRDCCTSIVLPVPCIINNYGKLRVEI